MKKRTLVELVQGHCENNPYLFNRLWTSLLKILRQKEISRSQNIFELSPLGQSPFHLRVHKKIKKTLSFLAFQIFFTRFPTPLNPYIYLIP